MGKARGAGGLLGALVAGVGSGLLAGGIAHAREVVIGRAYPEEAIAGLFPAFVCALVGVLVRGLASLRGLGFGLGGLLGLAMALVSFPGHPPTTVASIGWAAGSVSGWFSAGARSRWLGGARARVFVAMAYVAIAALQFAVVAWLRRQG